MAEALPRLRAALEALDDDATIEHRPFPNQDLCRVLDKREALACLDDACWPKWMRVAPDDAPRRTHWAWGAPRALANLVLLGAVAWLSWPVVANLLQLGGRHQAMNA